MTTIARAGLALLLLGAPVSAAPAADGKDFVAALREVLQEDHVDVRDAAWILEASGFQVDEVVAELAKALPGLDGLDAVEAEYMLGRLGPRAAAAVPALSARLSSSRDEDVRWEAARALALIRPAPRKPAR